MQIIYLKNKFLDLYVFLYVFDRICIKIAKDFNNQNKIYFICNSYLYYMYAFRHINKYII